MKWLAQDQQISILLGTLYFFEALWVKHELPWLSFSWGHTLNSWGYGHKHISKSPCSGMVGQGWDSSSSDLCKLLNQDTPHIRDAGSRSSARSVSAGDEFTYIFSLFAQGWSAGTACLLPCCILQLSRAGGGSCAWALNACCASQFSRNLRTQEFFPQLCCVLLFSNLKLLTQRKSEWGA